jgi:uncharacterized membrane protein YjfL (UPF0719 family)
MNNFLIFLRVGEKQIEYNVIELKADRLYKRLVYGGLILGCVMLVRKAFERGAVKLFFLFLRWGALDFIVLIISKLRNN